MWGMDRVTKTLNLEFRPFWKNVDSQEESENNLNVYHGSIIKII